MKNKFIVFEGIDGSGKSTQVDLLCQKMVAKGQNVYDTAEPSSGPVGRMIREIFAGKIPSNHHTIAGLFVADRLDHLLAPEEGLLAKLEAGYTVICDRYLFSSYAYQGAHVSLDWVIRANAEAARLLQPDLTIYLEMTPEESMARIQKTRATKELFETLENLKLVHTGYEKAFNKVLQAEPNGKQLHGPLLKIDARLDKEIVAAKIWEKIQSLT